MNRVGFANLCMRRDMAVFSRNFKLKDAAGFALDLCVWGNPRQKRAGAAGLAVVVEASAVGQKAEMTKTASVLLSVEHLSVARGDVLLIEDLSFAIGHGEALHLRGENGAGKSTVLLALAGLIPVAAGTVTVDPDAVAFLGHDNGLLPDLTVADNLSLYAQNGIRPSQHTEATLGLADLRDKAVRTLSFGEARRVALALTCLPDKAVWMLDEPFAGLDQQTAGALQSLLTDHVHSGTALIFSSHERGLDHARALDLSDQRQAHV